MPEASYEFLTLNRESDSPLIGELREGEVTINIVDGRIWVGDEFSNPVELGGNAHESIISNGSRSNYISVEVSSSDIFPIDIPNPNSITPGTYRELSLLMIYPSEYAPPETPPQTYFKYPILWDDSDYDLTDPQTPLSPPQYVGAAGVKVLYKLFTFGQQTSWYGKIAWINNG